ncbi:glycoside hydrolase family 97 protein [Draconibacterium sediminis]|uniref:glycoside hydrolase family 97 protein n=1 Tax=Draconibacterium sediminis TaxID=1544798 RepID=UPI0009E6362A|nr:glycoside hydrolase family 97 protein [Draconibacterium sediminis]
MLKLISIVISVFIAGLLANAKEVSVKSPDGKSEFILNVGDNLTYAVNFNGEGIIQNGRLGLKMVSAPAFCSSLEVVNSDIKEVDETWQPMQKQHEYIHNHYNELAVDFKEEKYPGRAFKIIARAYNNGIAFRYIVPLGADRQKCNLEKELTTFNFTSDVTCWVADYKSFASHQEEPFNKNMLSELTPDGLYGLPMTLKVAEDCYAAITEAHLDKWSGMYLKTTKNETELRTELSNIKNDGTEDKFVCKLELPHQSPWRVIMLGKTPGDLVESEIVMNLNPPCKLEDTSWIKPGLCAWDSWWSRGVVMENEEIKKYIDLASENEFPYMLIDWQWYGMYNKPEADVTTVADQLDMPMIIDYAKQKNVKLWLWLYWTDVTRNMEKAFQLYESWGIAGVKIDFMALDGAEMVEWYHNTVKLAAKHHLMVNFHGAYKPTGFRRTYPNLMTREGVLGNEYNKWSYMVTPEHNVTLPFTRMLAGPMDYTPGGFRNSLKGEFKPQINTRVMGTRCHELAKFVVFDSPITTVCDHPENYSDQQCVDFLQQVKTVWDDTRVLKGKIGEYIVMARKSRDQWFIAGMTNSDGRTFDIDLGFLPDGINNLRIYRDCEATKKDATKLEFEEMKIESKDHLSITCAPGGGFVGIISK